MATCLTGSEAEALTPQPIPFPAVAEASIPGIEQVPALIAAIKRLYPAAKVKDGVLSIPEDPDVSDDQS